MSAIYTSLVWTGSSASGVRKLVLLALADHVDRSGVAQLSLRDIATLCGVSKTAVQEHLKGLVTSGELQVLDPGSGRGNPAKYWITLKTCGTNRPPVQELEQARTDQAASAMGFAVLPVSDGVERAMNVQKAAMEEVYRATGVRMIHPGKLSDEDIKPGGVVLPAMKPVQVTPLISVAQEDVDAVVRAAGIQVDPNVPFFWSRGEHRAELRELAVRAGGVGAVVSTIEQARRRGVDFTSMKRVSAIYDAATRKGQSRG